MEDELGANKHRKLWISIIVAVVIVVAASVAFTLYVSDYYHADDRATAALQSTETVQVRTLRNGDIAFEPLYPRAGLVFYPGGKVQAEAYAPLMHALAERGFLSVLVPMPFNLAVLNVNGADGIQEQYPAIQKWILMGHSLGGSMAAAYADGHNGQWAGLVLLAAYSMSDLSDNDIDILCIRANNDEVLDMEMYTRKRGNLVYDAMETVIPGGNHAQFGDYGPQAGDGEATISAEQQQALTADAIAVAFLDSQSTQD